MDAVVGSFASTIEKKCRCMALSLRIWHIFSAQSKFYLGLRLCSTRLVQSQSLPLFAIHVFQYSNSSSFPLLNRGRVLPLVAFLDGYVDVKLGLLALWNDVLVGLDYSFGGTIFLD